MQFHHQYLASRGRRRAALFVGAAVLALSCVCPFSLSGSQPTPAAPAASTQSAEVATQPPASGGEGTPIVRVTPTVQSTIPPTAAVGEEYYRLIDGEITSADQENVHSFTAAPGQEFYFGVYDVSPELNLTKWRLEDEAGTVIFKKCIGCGDPGVFTLEHGGTYKIIVSEPESSSGTYQIVVSSVRVDYFPITLGDPIALGQPEPGAGGIEAPGARDMYTFEADPGQEVYFGTQEVNGLNVTGLELLDEDGALIFHAGLGAGNPGVYTLERGGTYTVIVGSRDNALTGTYGLIIQPARTDEFAYTLGDPIAPGQPGAGAGNIETPGARDVYSFTAAPGQQLTLDVTSADDVKRVVWMVMDENGEEVAHNCLGCGGYPKTLTLERGGTYTLTVGGGEIAATGTYELNLAPG
jgi:hypothetical protein